MIKQLDKKAIACEDMPTGLNQAEQMYYLSVRTLYSAYNNGEITKHQATKEKAMIAEQFQKNVEVMEMYQKIGYIFAECKKLHHKARPTVEEYRKIFEVIEREL